jgi:hypothetical protein
MFIQKWILRKASFSNFPSGRPEGCEKNDRMSVNMTVTKTAPYGSWKSPITPDLIVSETVGLSSINIAGDDIYWIEVRCQEEGRYVITHRSPDGQTTAVK